MAAIAPIRFSNTDQADFFPTLRNRVDAYFKNNGITRHANRRVAFKTAALLTLYLLPFILMLIFQPGWAISLGLWAVMGIGLAGVGMGVMHDANHGAYSANPVVNKWIGYSLFLLGGSVFTWKLQHNHLHHNFTNVTHYDDDIAEKPGLRLSPHTPFKPMHRFQWLNALFIYSLVTLYWVTAKDFLQLRRYAENGVSKTSASENRRLLFKMILHKVLYFGVVLGLPIWLGIAPALVFTGFLLMHLIGGVILTVIFQLAHAVEETDFPLPNEHGVLENEWAIHQLRTTVNFSKDNRLLSWYVGGLNYQVEHHLFPTICHIHYPAIAPIVRQTAAEFHVPYLEHASFGGALRSHFGLLRRLGKLPHLDDMMG